MRSLIAALSVVGIAFVAVLVWANRPLDKLPSGSKADRIVVEKSSHTLTLYAWNASTSQSVRRGISTQSWGLVWVCVGEQTGEPLLFKGDDFVHTDVLN